MQTAVRELTPVDVCIRHENGGSTIEWFEQQGMPVEDWTKEKPIEVPIYCSEEITFSTSMGSILDKAKEQFPLAKWDTKEDLVKLSDYNRLAVAYGLEQIQLEEGTYAVVCNFKLFEELRDAAVKGTIFAADYKGGKANYSEELDNKIYEMTETLTEPNLNGDNGAQFMQVVCKRTTRASSQNLAICISFVVVYIGIIFLLSSAAILALKCLSEAIDSERRFVILHKLGSDDGSLVKVLFLQIGCYFMMPMLIAVLHSVFGIRFAECILRGFIPDGLSWGTGLTAVLMLVLYGGYMIATCIGAKRVVESIQK